MVELQKSGLKRTTTTRHPYPATKVGWLPSNHASRIGEDLLATTGNTLRLWKYDNGSSSTSSGSGGGGEGPQLTPVCVLSNARSSQENTLAPLTSFDWSLQSPHKLGTASIDTTCTIGNLERQKIESQLIAHDKAVYDLAFSAAHDNLFSS